MTITMRSEDYPNKGGEVIRVAIAMSVLTLLSTAWRLVVRFRISPWMGSSDWLMLVGTIMGFICNIPYVIFGVQAGAGRVIADPFWKSHPATDSIRYQFISMSLQMNAMFLVKLSVCTYLLALNFSRRFRVVMWVITFIVFVFNLIMPLLFHFWSCRPYYFRWHPEIVPQCWPFVVGIVAEYAQIVSNILTDLVYTAAPLIYLRRAVLTKKMRYGVQLMFLLSIVGTISSVVKIYVLHKWLHSREAFYDIADVTTWGVNEISICILVANLPMQRKSLCTLIRFVVPDQFHSRLDIECAAGNAGDDLFTGTIEDPRVATPATGSFTLGEDYGSEMAIIELENGRIVMAPRTPTPVAVQANRSAGTLGTFWRNESKESFT